MINPEKLKNLLEEGNYTCVLSDGKEVISSTERGVKPLIKFIESGKSFKNFSAADKVVGKAAALLYALMGISRLYAAVISEEALAVCKNYDISVEYGAVTQKIINRKGDGICPMEEAAAGVSEPYAAFKAVKEKLEKLS